MLRYNKWTGQVEDTMKMAGSLQSLERNAGLNREPRKLVGAEWRTYGEWRDVGRQVMKGQKGTRRQGQILFSISQTKATR